jgi:hypothetical protein
VKLDVTSHGLLKCRASPGVVNDHMVELMDPTEIVVAIRMSILQNVLRSHLGLLLDYLFGHLNIAHTRS